MTPKIEVLIVEDEEGKSERILAVVRGVGIVNAVVARDVAEATRFLRLAPRDVLVLDMQIPFRRAEEPRADGGLRLLEALKTDTALNVPDHIVGLTQHDGLVDSLAPSLERDLWFLIKYEANSDGWSERLERLLVHVVETKARRTVRPYSTNLAILTALHQVELEGVLAQWPELEAHSEDGDDTIYHKGVIGERTVIAASASQMGMAAATALAMKMIDTFRPEYLCMNGIAAGAKGRFGDILVATQGWDYGSGKLLQLGINNSVFCPAPERIPMDEALKSQLEWFRIRHKTICEDIHGEWLDSKPTIPTETPGLHFGPMASGAAVVADRSVIDRMLALEDRKLVGVDMESYGVILAGRQCRHPRPRVLIAKSTCDFGDREKDDRFQKFAAFTSAAFTRRLFTSGFFARTPG